MSERWHYRMFVLVVASALACAAFPIAASDLFRQPYSRAWPAINRVLSRLRIDYNPPGGGLPPRFPSWQVPADAYLYYRDVTLTTSDGVRIAAWFVPTTSPDAASVILCHGLLDSKWTMLRIVPWLHDAGYNVLLFDFRGHGDSDHRPTSLGPDEVRDVQAALDWLEAEGAASRVGGLGMSLGAAALVNTAVVDGRLGALVLDSLFAEWQNVDYARGYRLPPEWLVPGVPDPVKLLPHVEVPVLIIHGTADILTRVDHAYRLYHAAKQPKRLWINDSGHAWSAWTYPQEYQSQVLEFLRTALRPDQAQSSPQPGLSTDIHIVRQTARAAQRNEERRRGIIHNASPHQQDYRLDDPQLNITLPITAIWPFCFRLPAHLVDSPDTINRLRVQELAWDAACSQNEHSPSGRVLPQHSAGKL